MTDSIELAAIDTDDPRPPEKRPPPEPDARREHRLGMARKTGQYMRYSTLGVEFALAILFGIGVGIWLDRWLETSVIFTLLGVIYGFGTGFYLVYRGVYSKDSGDPRDASPPGAARGPETTESGKPGNELDDRTDDPDEAAGPGGS